MTTATRSGGFALWCGLVCVLMGMTPAGATHWLPHENVHLEQVGAWSHGACETVAMQGDLLIYGEGTMLHFLQRTESGGAEEVASLCLDVPPAAIVIGDGVAYVACSGVSADRPLYAISVDNPERPYMTHRVDDAGAVTDLFIDGSRLYAAAVRLRIYDLTDPRHPEELSESQVGYARGVVAAGGIAYVAIAWDGLAVVDVTDPSDPVLLTTLPELDDQNFSDIAFHGQNLVVADADHGIRVLSLADPVAPMLIGGVEAYNLQRVRVVDGVAFTVTLTGGLRSFDLSDPTQPVQLDQYYAPPGHALAVDSRQAVIACGHRGLRAFWVDDPANIEGSWDRNAADQARDVDVRDDLMCIADGWAGLITVDVSDPRTPRELDRFEVGPGFMTRVVVDGDVAFLLSEYYLNNRLYAFDISDPEHISMHDSYGFTTWVTGLDVANGLVYVANGDQGLQIIDANEPDDLQLAGQAAFEYALDVEVRGDLALVASGFDGLIAVDISDPTQPLVIGQHATPNSATGIAVDGDLAYVGVEFDGVAVVDITDPTQLSEVAYADLPGNFNVLDISVRGGMVYVSGDSSPSVMALDVSDPAEPILVDPPTTVGVSDCCFIDDDHLYLACRDSGVQIFATHGPLPPGVWGRDEPLVHRCFPNPCNPMTTIEFDLPGSADVQVGIYDVAGRRIAEVWRGRLPAGRHHIPWRGRAQNGAAMASGLYLYRIESAAGMVAGKIQLIQ